MSDNRNTDLGALLQQRWTEACTKLPDLCRVPVSWTFGDSAHFQTARGFATTRSDGYNFWFTFAYKLAEQPVDRIDAIIRHEIGHVVDLAGVAGLPPELPQTIERRADAIAEFVWGELIYYDAMQVQTLRDGIRPRPEELGL